MGNNKNFVDELKKYNKELVNHLPGLDFDFMKSGNVFGDDSSYDEMSSLIASNLIDLKTEIALVRKNLSDSIEGMVLRSLNEQQSQFAKFMDDFNKKMVVGFKSSIASFTEEMGSELSKVKSEVEKLSLSNKILSDKLEYFDKDLKEFSDQVPNYNEFKEELNTNLNKKFSLIDSKFKELEKDVVSSFSSKVDILVSELNDIKRDDVKIREDIIGFKHSLSKINDMKIQNNRLENTNTPNTSKDLKNRVKIDTNIKSEDSVNQIKNSIVNDSKDFEFNPSPTVDKLISLDNRLKKLDSLR